MGIIVKEVSLISNVKEIIDATDETLIKAFEDIALSAEAHAVGEVDKLVYSTPESPNYVRTGELRRSITHESNGKQAVVGTNLEYAPYVEYGTKQYPKPRPFIKNAVENYIDEYKRILELYLQGML